MGRRMSLDSQKLFNKKFISIMLKSRSISLDECSESLKGSCQDL